MEYISKIQKWAFSVFEPYPTHEIFHLRVLHTVLEISYLWGVLNTVLLFYLWDVLHTVLYFYLWGVQTQSSVGVHLWDVNRALCFYLSKIETEHCVSTFKDRTPAHVLFLHLKDRTRALCLLHLSIDSSKQSSFSICWLYSNIDRKRAMCEKYTEHSVWVLSQRCTKQSSVFISKM